MGSTMGRCAQFLAENFRGDPRLTSWVFLYHCHLGGLSLTLALLTLARPAGQGSLGIPYPQHHQTWYFYFAACEQKVLMLNKH